MRRSTNPLHVLSCLDEVDGWLSVAAWRMPTASVEESMIWRLKWNVRRLRGGMESLIVARCESLVDSSTRPVCDGLGVLQLEIFNPPGIPPDEGE